MICIVLQEHSKIIRQELTGFIVNMAIFSFVMVLVLNICALF